ncbi:hypothetical protein E4T56_gene3784 [Termitomyces sp. T112]|nr:hypothetical protein E4T56_gene3784 [Termitomyces sp. T112]
MYLRISHLLRVITLVGLLQTNAVLASVYPTHPVAKTKLFSGKPEVITWRDDARKPYLEDMSHMKIELYNNTDYIATLAKQVDPTDRSHTVSIPSKLQTGYTYALVFKTINPPMSFWSADFTILSESQNYIFSARPAVVNTTTTTAASSSSSSSSSSTPSSSSKFDSSTVPTPHPNPIGAHPGSPYRDGGDESKNSAATKLDSKTMHLRVLVVFLAALAGASMAL